MADAVNVTDGAGARPTLGAVDRGGMLVEAGIEPILQFTCRDRNRIALQSDLMGAAAPACAICWCCAATIRPPAISPTPSRCSISMRANCSRPHACCATKASCRPAARSAGAPISCSARRQSDRSAARLEPKALDAKIAAGAQFAQTQFCMDTGVVRRYMARLAEHGLADKLYLLIGIVPLRSAKSARWIKEKLFGAIIPDAMVERIEQAADPIAEGRRICLDVIAELADIPHVAGCHIMAPGNDAVVPDIITAARESVSRLAPV